MSNLPATLDSDPFVAMTSRQKNASHTSRVLMVSEVCVRQCVVFLIQPRHRTILEDFLLHSVCCPNVTSFAGFREDHRPYDVILILLRRDLQQFCRCALKSCFNAPPIGCKRVEGDCGSAVSGRVAQVGHQPEGWVRTHSCKRKKDRPSDSGTGCVPQRKQKSLLEKKEKKERTENRIAT